jgi:hypothetical protein
VIKRIGVLAMVALIAAMMVVATAAPAFAKLAEQTTNPAGHTTQGDAAGEPPQDTDVVNPGGNEPPGHNKGDAVAG